VALMEQWRDIPSLEGYQASTLGRVRGEKVGSMPNGSTRLYKTGPTYGMRVRTTGRFPWRMQIQVCGKNHKVHRLVCEAFHGPCPENKTDVMHLNEISIDNRPENLRWGTRKENLNSPGVKRYHREVCRQKMAGEKVSS